MAPSRVAFSVLLLAQLAAPALGEGRFLGNARHRVALEQRGRDFQAAMGEVMGCGASEAGHERLAEIERRLAPMWRALPKNQHGNVEWKMLRYAAHRYFMQRYQLLVRGFEPTRQVNASHMGAAAILSQQAPALTEAAFGGTRAAKGFSLQDGVMMVATLEQLIFDAESALLERVYRHHRHSTKQLLSAEELNDLMESYMIHWMMGDDQEGIDMLMANASLREELFPHWGDIANFAKGTVRSIDFERRAAPAPGSAGRLGFSARYSFEDVHQAVGGITQSFASYWEQECLGIKASLVAMDRTGTGRVSITDFYGANGDGEWRFGESEAYLRDLGALDDSSAWRGKQVIIPNYLQGASNCIVTHAHYLVCCANECEDMLGAIEDAVGGPVADAQVVLELVGNMTNYDDVPPSLDQALRGQLLSIASSHGGKVPLHGRLFAQWLHYIFPRECAFPHKSGTATALTPSEFGDFLVSEETVSTHAAARTAEPRDAEIAEPEVKEQWLSQWSEEEELHADYSLALDAPWEPKGRGVLLGGAAAALLAAFALVARLASAAERGGTAKGASVGRATTWESKAHFV